MPPPLNTITLPYKQHQAGDDTHGKHKKCAYMHMRIAVHLMHTHLRTYAQCTHMLSARYTHNRQVALLMCTSSSSTTVLPTNHTQ